MCFGGGGPSAPPPPAPPPEPTKAPQATESLATAAMLRRRKQGILGTIASSPLGAGGEALPPQAPFKKLLGD